MRAFIGDRLILPISLRSEIPRSGRSTGRPTVLPACLLACLPLRAPKLRSEMHSTTEVHRVCSWCTTAAKKAESRGRNLFIVHHHAQSPFRKNGDPACEGSPSRRISFSFFSSFVFYSTRLREFVVELLDAIARSTSRVDVSRRTLLPSFLSSSSFSLFLFFLTDVFSSHTLSRYKRRRALTRTEKEREREMHLHPYIRREHVILTKTRGLRLPKELKAPHPLFT